MATTKKTAASSKKAAKAATKATPKSSTVKMPEVQEFLKAGVQFGHQSKKWNPKMKKFIFTKRDQIHIIDISKTLPALEKALIFLQQVAEKGSVLFVGTKRQAAEITRELAIDAGAFYINHRWPGGLLTNFNMLKKSLKVFNELEAEFESGIEDRTKFEVSQMKKEWEKMSRLYEGIKSMVDFPKAIVVVDTKYERNTIREAKSKGIPVIGMVDTNSDPANIDYPIPANDDAVRSLRLILGLLAEAVKKGNKGNGVKHKLKDYSKFEVKLIKTEVKAEDKVEIEVESRPEPKVVKPIKVVPTERKKAKSTEGKGLLEQMQEESETAKRKKAKKVRRVKK
ncbi:MAG: 30S ribosomal protein S2 [Candidatus Dojkabacteria bacterium]